MSQTITDTRGEVWRVDQVITGQHAARVQLYPGTSQLNLSPPDSATRCHCGISVRTHMLPDILAGRVRLRVS